MKKTNAEYQQEALKILAYYHHIRRIAEVLSSDCVVEDLKNSFNEAKDVLGKPKVIPFAFEPKQYIKDMEAFEKIHSQFGMDAIAEVMDHLEPFNLEELQKEESTEDEIPMRYFEVMCNLMDAYNKTMNFEG